VRFPIVIANRRRGLASLQHAYPGHAIYDLTSRSADSDFQRFSPFFPHGGIPVPFSGLFSQSVEGLWQGLKVFDLVDGNREEIDTSCFANTTQKGLKRTLRRRGRVRCVGHYCIASGALLGYLDARREIYLPAYNFVLEHRLGSELQALAEAATQSPLVFLDYSTNADLSDSRTPLSHAALVRDHLMRFCSDE
jgi:hypothetical protein